MSEVEPRADAPLVDWSELGVSGLLPTGTVTLLLADVEGSTRLWETQPEEMTAAVARFEQTASEVIAAYGGARPVEQGEGDSFVAAFARASDAVACALELQRAPLAPIRLRIGVHTGEVQLRDESNYAGPTINRTARLRDLGHGGQTVLSATTSDLVVDRLPEGAWLTDLGMHPLRDLPRPERVVQLCHPDLRNDFPPLRVPKHLAVGHLPVQLTNFVGRGAQINDIRQILADNRLVTLTGAGGVGKTRLAVQVAAGIASEFGDGAWDVDLAPITDPGIVPITVARALGLADQMGRSTIETVTRFIGDRHMLMVLDNRGDHRVESRPDPGASAVGSRAQPHRGRRACPNGVGLALAPRLSVVRAGQRSRRGRGMADAHRDGHWRVTPFGAVRTAGPRCRRRCTAPSSPRRGGTPGRWPRTRPRRSPSR